MLCPNCFNTTDEKLPNCTKCGAYLNQNDNNVVKENKESFIKKNKKLIMIITSIITIIVVALIIFFTLWDSTKISWDSNYGDYNTTHTGPKTVELKVKAYDKEVNKIYDIEYKVDAGEIKVSGTKVEWTLPNKSGKYTITAIAPSGKKITKTIQVIDEKLNEPFKYQEEVETDEDDSDGDTLTNGKELELGTDPYLIDTDLDGLGDDIEINETKTDPLKKDTDGDSISDGYELDLSLDPLKADSKGDGTNDSERKLNYTLEYSNQGVTIDITGKGEISNTTVDTMKNKTFSSTTGVMDTIYSFYTTGNLESAKVKIKYDESSILNKGLSEDSLVLYYFNEETQELEATETIVDKDNNTVTVTLTHFSKYILGDSSKVQVKLNTDILFILDNSISMYTMEQMEEYGYENETGASGYDSEFKRITLTNQMIDMLNGNYNYAVSEFAGSYNLLQGFTNEKEDVKKAVSSIKGNWSVSLTGTRIIKSLKAGIEEFDVNGNSHYIMLLTDGENTNDYWYTNKKEIINSAKEKNVKICVIGLGTDIDEKELNEVAEGTGCDYYNAIDTSVLEQIYDKVSSDINYGYIDTDKDKKTDSMIIADSGFIAARDGFSFPNFNSTKIDGGHCYGMAGFANLYYRDMLPLKAKESNKGKIKKYKESEGYNLNYTYFMDGGNLYDYRFTNDALVEYFYDDTEKHDRIEDGVWKLNEKYVEKIESINGQIKTEKEAGEGYNSYEYTLIGVETEGLKEHASNEEYQLLSAIWRIFIEQVDDDKVTFKSSPDKAYEKLITDLNDGNPLVLVIDNGHAVNATRVIQDNNDPNKFKIEIYNNEHPGEPQYINMTRSKFSKIGLGIQRYINDYQYIFTYDSDGDGVEKKIKVSLYDVEID